MAAARYVHEVVAAAGSFEFLREIEHRSSVSAFELEELTALMADSGVEDGTLLLDDLLAVNLLRWYGDRIGLTQHGVRTTLLLEALNGADIKSIYERLSQHDVGLRMYELIREGMTSQFIESLVARPAFGRLYICSPWISLNPRQCEILLHTLMQADRRGGHPELWVITRPEPGTTDVPPPGVQPLRDLGATVVLNHRLHTKLYIREPDENGGYIMAIVGSQNLTGSNYFELGIRINSDGRLVDQLIVYFVELMNAGLEVPSAAQR